MFGDCVFLVGRDVGEHSTGVEGEVFGEVWLIACLMFDCETG